MSSITRFDVKKADEQLRQLEEEMKEIRHHLRHLTGYAIAWFLKLLEKYGKGRERRTQIREFEAVQAAQVALAKIGRAHVCTPVTNAHLVCRLLLQKKKKHIQ